MVHEVVFAALFEPGHTFFDGRSIVWRREAWNGLWSDRWWDGRSATHFGKFTHVSDLGSGSQLLDLGAYRCAGALVGQELFNAR